MAEWCSLDFETRSTVDLKKSGVYPYAMHPSTDVWLARYAFDDGPVQRWNRGEPMPADLVAHILRGGKIRAWNAAFERIVMFYVLCQRQGWPVPRLEQFWCTAAQAAAMSLPRSLDQCALALNLPIRKDKEGYSLMLRMARPRKIEADGTIIWWDEPEKIERLGRYCDDDVRVERMIAGRLRQLPDAERAVYLLDQQINDRGVLLDLELIDRAQDVAERSVKRLNEKLRQATGGKVGSANKAAAITTWLREQGVEAEGVSKAAVAELLAQDDLASHARDVLEIRKEAAKASTAKLKAMNSAVCDDARVRGLLLYHGAGTGRWAGKLVQPQNFPRGTIENPELAIPLLMDGDLDLLEILFGAPLDVVSSNLRSCLTAGEGNDLIACDFSNIEGRVTAWLAGEKWKLDAFRAYDAGTGPDLYKLAYSKSFNIPVKEVTKQQRQVGKVEELALGFGGGVGAFQTMAKNLNVKMSDEEADEIKVGWRAAHPRTEALWYELDEAACRAMRQPGAVVAAARGRIRFVFRGGHLWMVLPSGRALCYPHAALEDVETPWGSIREGVTYWGVDTYTKKWSKQKTYGGFWCENAVQAIARDLLVAAMFRLEASGYPLVLTVHDEAVTEIAEDFGSVADVEVIMCALPDWAAGLPVTAEGWRGKRYRK